jgi:hypothetical protein
MSTFDVDEHCDYAEAGRRRRGEDYEEDTDEESERYGNNKFTNINNDNSRNRTKVSDDNNNDEPPITVPGEVAGYFKHCGLEQLYKLVGGTPHGLDQLVEFAKGKNLIKEAPTKENGDIDTAALCQVLGEYYREHPEEIQIDLTRYLSGEVKIYLIDIVSELLDSEEPRGLSNQSLHNLSRVNKEWNLFASKHDRYVHPASESPRSKLRDYIAKFWASAITSMRSPLTAGFSILMPFGDKGEYRVAMVVRRRLMYELPGVENKDFSEEYYSMTTKCYLEVVPTKYLLREHEKWFSQQVRSTSIVPRYLLDADEFLSDEPPSSDDLQRMNNLEREFWGGLFARYGISFRKRSYPLDMKLIYGPHYYPGKTGSDIDTSQVPSRKYIEIARDSPGNAPNNPEQAELEDDFFLVEPYAMRPWDLFNWLITRTDESLELETEYDKPYNYYEDRKYGYDSDVKSTDYTFDIKKAKLVFHPWLGSLVNIKTSATEFFHNGYIRRSVHYPLSEVHPGDSELVDVIEFEFSPSLNHFVVGPVLDPMSNAYLSEHSSNRGSGIAWYWFVNAAMNSVQPDDFEDPDKGINIRDSSPISAMNLFYSLYSFGRWPDQWYTDKKEAESRKKVFRQLASKAVIDMCQSRHLQKHAIFYSNRA